VREDVDDPSFGDDVGEEGLTAQRGNRVEVARRLLQRALDGRDFRDVAKPARHAEVLRVGEFRSRQHLLEHLERAAAVG
jgi:hypothetical protein